MTYDIIEHLPKEEEEHVMPLPTRLSETDRYSGLDLSSDGLEVRYNGSASKTDVEAATVRADYPMSPQSGIYYYEIAIRNKHKDGMIAIGFSSQKANLERLPGWEQESYAYHGDDGNMFFGENQGKKYGPIFGKDDTIGCGINFANNTAFFTKNGHELGVAFRDLRNPRPFPAIGMKKYSGTHIMVNFGQRPFIFDIDGMCRREKLGIEQQISTTKVNNLHPPLDEHNLIQELVAHFLAHDGYVETAKAFASERKAQLAALGNESSASANDFVVEDDHDAINRQSRSIISIRVITLMKNRDTGFHPRGKY